MEPISAYSRPFAAGLLVLGLFFRAHSEAWAQDRPKEDDLFGSPAASATPAAPSPQPTQDLGADARGLSREGTRAHFEESVQIGGTLSSEADYYIRDGVPFLENTASNPNLLFLYLDAKMENDARVFARGRLFYDPTGVSGGSAGSLSDPYGAGPGAGDNLKTSLQELRISANLDRKLFFTIGRQKVKYGAAKFFNPTDFLNPTPFNFFLPSDERGGVDMVKMHVPFGTSNFYAVGLAGNQGTGAQPGGYFRFEGAYDGLGGFLGSGEISLSGILPKGSPGKAGFDLSQAVGDLDVYFEMAAGQDAAGEWKEALSAGGTWEIRYADRGSNTVSLQAEYFNAGTYADYGVFSLYLPEPGSLKDITFVGSNLYSFRDKSGLSRLDVVYAFTPQISGRIYGSGHWGALGGVFRLPGQVAELGTRLDVNF